MRERCRSIARVERSHGRFGEVVTVPVHGLPSLVREGLELCPVPPALEGPRWLRVARVQEDPARSGVLVALDGVTTIGQAEALVGATLLVRVADLPADLVLLDAEALLGREVADATTGGRGTIDEVLRGPANDVWVVRGELGELLVPVVPEVVGPAEGVPAEGTICVRVPQGLDWEGALAGEGTPCS